MKRAVLLAAALFAVILAACSSNVKVTYIVWTTSSDASTMPAVTVVYRHQDGTDHTTTIAIAQGFQYSMSVPLGTHIDLRATDILPAPDGNSRILTQVNIDDSAIADRESDCTNGVANPAGYPAGSYELICDFEGEARGVAQ